MLKVFYGENRVAAQAEVRRELGEGYEVYEGENLRVEDLPSIFQGVTLLGTGERRILLKGLADSPAVFEKIVDFSETEHRVVVWEEKIDKRSTVYKRLKAAGFDIREFPALKKPEANLVFGVFDTAMQDGEKAVRDVERIETEQDPYMFFGLLISQAMKRYEYTGGGARERRILKEMAKTDVLMKSSQIGAWELVKSFLLRVGKL